jgi:hypothetical protein
MIKTISEVDECAGSEGFAQILGQLLASGQGLNRTRVSGIIGCRSGDGASFVQGTLARLLTARSGKRILQADCADLFAASRLTPAELLARCWFTDQPGRWVLSRSTATGTQRLDDQASEADLRNMVSVLDPQFDFVLLNCGSVTASGRLWQLAPLIDDLFLVVAAGETRREQVLYAQRMIEQSGARLSGCILNKRTYPLPAAIHRLLS